VELASLSVEGCKLLPHKSQDDCITICQRMLHEVHGVSRSSVFQAAITFNRALFTRLLFKCKPERRHLREHPIKLPITWCRHSVELIEEWNEMKEWKGPT
jgi:hypothetical protein